MIKRQLRWCDGRVFPKKKILLDKFSLLTKHVCDVLVPGVTLSKIVSPCWDVGYFRASLPLLTTFEQNTQIHGHGFGRRRRDLRYQLQQWSFKHDFSSWYLLWHIFDPLQGENAYFALTCCVCALLNVWGAIFFSPWRHVDKKRLSSRSRNGDADGDRCIGKLKTRSCGLYQVESFDDWLKARQQNTVYVAGHVAEECETLQHMAVRCKHAEILVFSPTLSVWALGLCSEGEEFAQRSKRTSETCHQQSFENSLVLLAEERIGKNCACDGKAAHKEK
jgi:hypothetical protein